MDPAHLPVQQQIQWQSAQQKRMPVKYPALTTAQLQQKFKLRITVWLYYKALIKNYYRVLDKFLCIAMFKLIKTLV